MTPDDPTRPDAVVARGPDLTDRVDWLVRDGIVHRSLYTDPDLFWVEMERIFGATRVYLAHVSEVRGPGDFVRRRMGPRQVIVTRQEDGSLRGLQNRCTHRGTTLVGEARGCAQRFVCPYHGCSFDLDGTIRNLPVPDSYDRPFDLGQVLLAEQAGFVFGTLAAAPTASTRHSPIPSTTTSVGRPTPRRCWRATLAPRPWCR